MAVVVVESPAKAKTINKYLGPDYTVLASYGHVRDLPPKDGSVDPDNGFAMEWEVANDSKKHVKAIADALKDDHQLILATDPDREGEAISWHLLEALTKRRAVKPGTPVECGARQADRAGRPVAAAVVRHLDASQHRGGPQRPHHPPQPGLPLKQKAFNAADSIACVKR